jgi:predicted 3-demethylubiquinone-9 3-methyltransferase (glyoxalase superfamily)
VQTLSRLGDYVAALSTAADSQPQSGPGNGAVRMTAKMLSPCLWFDTEAEAAARHYVSIFKDSKLGRISRFSNEGTEVHGKEAGSVMTVEFEINGQPFLALNGGPQFKFTEAVSFQILCETQAEVDYFWRRLAEGGEEGPCGWLKDKFGLSWQVVPAELPEMLQDHQSERARRVMRAMLQMRKLDIAALKRAQVG